MYCVVNCFHKISKLRLFMNCLFVWRRHTSKVTAKGASHVHTSIFFPLRFISHLSIPTSHPIMPQVHCLCSYTHMSNSVTDSILMHMLGYTYNQQVHYLCDLVALGIQVCLLLTWHEYVQ